MAWGWWWLNCLIFKVDITFKTQANDSKNNVLNFVESCYCSFFSERSADYCSSKAMLIVRHVSWRPGRRPGFRIVYRIEWSEKYVSKQYIPLCVHSLQKKYFYSEMEKTQWRCIIRNSENNLEMICYLSTHVSRLSSIKMRPITNNNTLSAASNRGVCTISTCFVHSCNCLGQLPQNLDANHLLSHINHNDELQIQIASKGAATWFGCALKQVAAAPGAPWSRLALHQVHPEAALTYFRVYYR